MSPLFGGEFVVAFLGVRIALWIWRSRKELRTLAGHDGPGGPDGGTRRAPAPRRAEPGPALRVVPPAAPGALRRAA